MTDRAAAPDDESAVALAELAALVRAIEDDVQDPVRSYGDAQARAAARAYALNALHHGLQFWLDADPARPVFHRWFTQTKKLLGDNQDAVYYGTAIDPTRTYRIRGNVHGACYTSFTVEAGTQGAHMSTHLSSTLNDTEFDVAPDGSYEILAGPGLGGRNRLGFDPDSGSITTRHYYEWEQSVIDHPYFQVPLTITPVDDPGAPPIPDDAAVATGIRRVITFVRTSTVDFLKGERVRPAWVSEVPNQFVDPPAEGGHDEIGYAAIDNVYRQARFVLGPGEALEIRGRFPRCRFANVMLFNRHMQTLPQRTRRSSLNRRQTVLEPDGSFRMVVSATDPGVPNWLDTGGMPYGIVFWRFLLTEEPIPPLETRVLTDS